jgi:hypothetical protein
MARPKRKPQLGATVKPFPIRLSTDINEDLWAFSELQHGAAKNRIVEAALRSYIAAYLEKHPTLVAEFQGLRDSLRAKPTPVAEFPRQKRDEDPS